jgi:hypothetical protein
MYSGYGRVNVTNVNMGSAAYGYDTLHNIMHHYVVAGFLWVCVSVWVLSWCSLCRAFNASACMVICTCVMCARSVKL